MGASSLAAARERSEPGRQTAEDSRKFGRRSVVARIRVEREWDCQIGVLGAREEEVLRKDADDGIGSRRSGERPLPTIPGPLRIAAAQRPCGEITAIRAALARRVAGRRPPGRPPRAAPSSEKALPVTRKAERRSGSPVAGERRAPGRERGELLEGTRGCHGVLEVRDGIERPVSIHAGGPDPRQALGLAERKGPQKHRPHHLVDGRVGADAEGQDETAAAEKPGAPRERAQRVAQVLEEAHPSALRAA